MNLDYKASMPEKLENTVCALANTYGGVIVIGINEENYAPKLPVEGMPLQEGFYEQAIQIIMSNISPPIMPEVQVCAKGGKCFVVIRVQESDIGPHATAGNTKIYFRTGKRNQPEDIADVDRILWLASRRQKANELREQLFSSMLKRAENAMVLKKAKIEFGQAALLASPLHPYQPFVQYDQMLEIGRTVQAFWEDYKIPRNAYDARVVLNGVAYSYLMEGVNLYSYTEYNQYGLACHIEDFGWNINDPKNKDQVVDQQIRLHHIVRSVDVFLQSCAHFFKELGFWGVVKFQFRLDGIAFKNFVPLGEYHYGTPKTQSILDPHVQLERAIPAKMLDSPNGRASFTLQFCTELAWAFGYPKEGPSIERYLKENRRLQ